MSALPKIDRQQGSFAETALRLSGKTDEEARRTGAVDRADDEIESLFAPQYQTVNSPVHRAVWDHQLPLELFKCSPAPEVGSEKVIERCLDIVRRGRQEDKLYDQSGKIAPGVLEELGRAGYWGMLIDKRYGGQGSSFSRFSAFLTQMAMFDPVVAGLASVHGCIGAVDPIRTFGNAEQKARFLPKLASGESLSAFALTEPCAGSDLTALRTTAVMAGEDLEINGEKLFITNAVPGRTIGLVVMLAGKPAVVIVELPERENEHFQVVRYGLHALRHTYNNGLRFKHFRVPRANLLEPPLGDGLTIAYHGLNLGRIALCANAAGTMRILLANMLPWADFRHTYGQAINSRELVRRRIARMAGLIAGADALVAWCSGLIDQGFRGELECVIAKIYGSEALKEAAIELFMKTHGGRSFLKGHLFGDNIHDFLAPCIYEGEGEMLGMAFFKTLVKHHGLKYFEPIGRSLQNAGIRQFNPANPLHLWHLRQPMSDYAKWVVHERLARRPRLVLPRMDGRLAVHAQFAAVGLGNYAYELSTVMRKHQLKLADRQCRIAELSQRIQDTVVLLVTALWGSRQGNDVAVSAADILCQDLRRKLTGQRPTDSYFRDCNRLAKDIIEGGFEAIAGAPRVEIMMSYDNQRSA
jgi:alkylation response protein AidB-like acyl-CoA dehydrogenase